jgi:hypothetical protein
VKIVKWTRAILLLAFCLVVACGEADRVTVPADHSADRDFQAFYYHDRPFNRTPADFRAVYGFLTGTSLGPTHSYAYDIVINRDIADTIYMELGVFGNNIVSRAEAFDASTRQMNDLFELMLEQGLFRDYWEMLPPEEWPSGGPGRSIWVRASEEIYCVGGFIVDEDDVMPVYHRMAGLVPDGIWDELWAWRDEYIAGQP